MSLAVAVTTAPRPVETLTRSTESLRRAGFEDAAIVSDGPVVSRDGFVTYVNSPPLGGLKNWCWALQMLVETTQASWLMVAEDDVLWAKGAAAALAQDLEWLDAKGDVGYLSLYTCRKVSREIERRKGGRLGKGLHKSALGAGCWGSQAYVIPRSSAVALLANEAFDDFRRNYVKNRNRDNIVSGCLAAMGFALYYRVPCLVSHEMGSANSSLSTKPVQRGLLTDYWTGKP